MGNHPATIVLQWTRDLRFQARAGAAVTAIDGEGETGPSPVLLLLEALAACSAADVVEILRKGRQELRGLQVRAIGERRPEPPRRFTRLRLEFRVQGPVERKKAERAVELSLETYCSVYHTLREDLDLEWELRIEEEGTR
ncbi:MAG: OsmC family protein [Gemmatimonadota bacterium]